MPDTANESQPHSAFKREAAKVIELAEIAVKAEMVAFLSQSREDIEHGATLPAKAFLESLGKKKP